MMVMTMDHDLMMMMMKRSNDGNDSDVSIVFFISRDESHQ